MKKNLIRVALFAVLFVAATAGGTSTQLAKDIPIPCIPPIVCGN